MNNIDLILDSIKEDAKKEADNILSSAKKEAEENLEKRKKEAEKEAEKILSSADHESKLLVENSKTTANREARDIKIRAQNEVVAEVLEELKERLKAVSDEKYKKYVLNSLKNMKLENGEILLQKDKINSLTKEELNNLKISKDTVDEGFVVRSGKIEYDSKFSSIVDYNKDIYEKIIVEEIFKWGDWMDREDFIQASATTRVYEKNILSKAQLDRLVDSESLHQAIQSLTDTVYNESIQKMGRDEEYEVMLSNELKRVYKEMSRLSPDPLLIDYLKQQYIFHDLKVIAKEVIQDKDYSNIYIDFGDLNLIDLKKSLKEEENFTVNDDYYEILKNSLDEYKDTKDPQIIDISIDKAYYKKLLQIANESKLDFLIDFTKERIDLINIKTLFRANRQKVDKNVLDSALIEGGNIEISTFDGLLGEDLANYKEIFSNYSVGDYVKRAFEKNDTDRIMLDLEKAIDDHQMDLIKKAKTITYGPEVIYGYIVAKETEIKNLRIILISKLNSLSRDFIQERLRESYV